MAFLIYDEHCFQAKVFIHNKTNLNKINLSLVTLYWNSCIISTKEVVYYFYIKIAV